MKFETMSEQQLAKYQKTTLVFSFIGNIK